jgi:hypothetical protein
VKEYSSTPNGRLVIELTPINHSQSDALWFRTNDEVKVLELWTQLVDKSIRFWRYTFQKDEEVKLRITYR